MDAAETHLGFPLPALLRRLYLDVGNGGFGPGYGLFGLPVSGAHAGESLVGKYADLRQSASKPPWPEKLIPLCDWGCGIASYLDCSRPEAPVVRLDPNMAKADVAGRVPAVMHFDRANQVAEACWVESPSLRAWLEAWADGQRLFYLGYGDPDADGDDEEEEGREEEE